MSLPLRRPADVIREHLARYVGPFTAKNAVQMFSQQIAKTDADAVTAAQAPEVLAALGPMLRTLLGKDGADKVLEQIRKELPQA